MTKRKLDEQEIDMATKGIGRVETQINEIKEQIDFNEKTIAFQKIQNEYQDAVRPYLMKKKAEDDNRVMGALKEQLARLEDNLKTLKDQIKSGVIIK